MSPAKFGRWTTGQSMVDQQPKSGVPRTRTGVPGLDTVLNGGFVDGGV